MGDNNVKLPPGFWFCPSDEELIVHFLHRKTSLLPCHPDVIPDLHLHPYDPWDLDGIPNLKLPFYHIFFFFLNFPSEYKLF